MTQIDLPHPAPAHYFAARLRRRQPFSYVRLGPARRAGGPWLPDLERRLRALPAEDPDLFLEADGTVRSQLDPARWGSSATCSARPGSEASLWRRATLDGTIRAVYAALRPFHVVAVGPGHLIELAERIRFASFTLVVADSDQRAPDRHELLTRLHDGHRRFFGAPCAYLFHGGPVASWWVLELHGRLRNAFLIDFGSALDACVAERVVGQGWGRIHWQAVARHLGIDPGPGRSPAQIPPPHPSEAPGRTRPRRRAPAIERRSASGPRPPQTPTRWERLREGDLQRCLSEAVDPPPSGPRRTSEASSRPPQR